MTKRINKILLLILSLLFVAMAALGLSFIGEKNVVNATGDPTPKIVGRNIAFGEKAYMYFAVQVENENSAYTPKVFLWKEDEDYTNYAEAEELIFDCRQDVFGDGYQYYLFLYRDLLPKEITDNVYVRPALFDAHGTKIADGAVKKTSILSYCKKIIDNPTSNEGLKDVLNSLLEYGASIQEYAEYNLDRLATFDFFNVTLEDGLAFTDGFSEGLFTANETLPLRSGDEVFEENGSIISKTTFKPTGNMVLKKANVVDVSTAQGLIDALMLNSKIRLTADINVTNGFTVTNGKFIDLDLNGHTITVSKGSAFTNNGVMTIKNSNTTSGGIDSATGCSQVAGNGVVNRDGILTASGRGMLDLGYYVDNGGNLQSNPRFILDEFGDVEFYGIVDETAGVIDADDYKNRMGERVTFDLEVTVGGQIKGITCDTLIITKGISTPEDLKNFGKVALKLGEGENETLGYYMVMNDIDFKGYKFLKENSFAEDYNSRFNGTFDGNGHVIDNLTINDTENNANYAFIGYIGEKGAIKNVAFKNLIVRQNLSFNRASYYGGRIENVYLGYKIYAANLEGTASVSNNNNPNGVLLTAGVPSCALKNVVIDLGETGRRMQGWYSTINTNYGKIIGNLANSTFADVVFLNVPTKFKDNVSFRTVYGSTDGAVYMTEEELKNEKGPYVSYSTGTNNGVSVITSHWDETYWTINNGLPEFGGHEHSFGGEFKIKNDSNHYKYCFTCGVVVEEPHTLSWRRIGNKLTYSCACGYTEVSMPLNNVVSSTYLAISDTETLNSNLDFGYRGIAGLTVKYFVDSTEVTTFNSAYVAAGSQTGEVNIKVNVTGNNVEFNDNVEVIFADALISNEQEFLNLKNLVSGNDNDGYYLLTNDITLTQTFYNGSKDGSGNINIIDDYRIMVLKGVINGNGHTVSGMKLITSWINSEYQGGWIDALQGGTIKNIAFTNVTVYNSNSVLVSRGYGTIENVYVKLAYNTGYIDQSTTIMFGGGDCTAKTTFIRNVLFDYSEMTTRLSTHSGTRDRFFGGISNGTEVENAIVLGLPIEHKEHLLENNKTDPNGITLGVYAKYSDGSTNGTQFPSTGWDERYWTFENGMPKFK